MVDSMGKMCTPLNVELHSYSGVMSYTKQLREVLKKIIEIFHVECHTKEHKFTMNKKN